MASCVGNRDGVTIEADCEVEVTTEVDISGTDISGMTIGTGTIGTDTSSGVTIGRDTSGVTIGRDTSGATIGRDTSGVTIGRDSSGVTIGRDTSGVTIGRDTSGVTIGRDTSGVTIGRDTSGVTIGRDTSDVTIGRDSSGVTIGRDTSGVTIGRDTSGVTIGRDTSGVTIGRDTSGVTIGRDTSGVTIGRDTSGVTIGKDTSGVTIGTDTSGVTIGTDTSAWVTTTDEAIDVGLCNTTNESLFCSGDKGEVNVRETAIEEVHTGLICTEVPSETTIKAGLGKSACGENGLIILADVGRREAVKDDVITLEEVCGVVNVEVCNGQVDIGTARIGVDCVVGKESATIRTASFNAAGIGGGFKTLEPASLDGRAELSMLLTCEYNDV